MLSVEEPYPAEKKVRRYFKELTNPVEFEPTAWLRTHYLDLIEPTVRQAATWLNHEGGVIDPFLKEEYHHSTARLVGADILLRIIDPTTILIEYMVGHRNEVHH